MKSFSIALISTFVSLGVYAGEVSKEANEIKMDGLATVHNLVLGATPSEVKDKKEKFTAKKRAQDYCEYLGFDKMEDFRLFYPGYDTKYEAIIGGKRVYGHYEPIKVFTDSGEYSHSVRGAVFDYIHCSKNENSNLGNNINASARSIVKESDERSVAGSKSSKASKQ